MYYEEKVIDGVLYWRNSPDGVWMKISQEELTQRAVRVVELEMIETALRRKCKRYKKYIKGLQRGMEWRNGLLKEMMFQLGYTAEELAIPDVEHILYTREGF